MSGEALAKNCFGRKLFKISLSFRNFKLAVKLALAARTLLCDCGQPNQTDGEKCEKSTNQEIQKSPSWQQLR
jgi:hypothetical protein